VKIAALEICNFMAIGEAFVELEDRGLVLVEGENRDDTSANSNGAGKSSIADALCWALFGTTARGESGDAVVNQTAGKDCSVSVLVKDDDGASYHIQRFRKHKTGKNAVTIRDLTNSLKIVDLTKGTDKLTQEVINKVIGCSEEVFRSSIYAGQSTMPDLPGMTDRNLKAIVEEAAGIVILEAAYDEARKRHAKVKEGSAAVDEAVRRTQDRIENGERHLVELTASRFQWVKAQDEKIAVTRAWREGRVEAIEKLKKKIVAADLSTVESKLTGIQKAMEAISDEQAKERKLALEYGRSDAKIVGYKTQLRTLKERHDNAKAEVGETDHKIGCPCDECGRPLTAAEIAPVKAARESRVASLARDFHLIRDEAAAALEAHKTLAENLETFRASMTDASSLVAVSKSLNDQRAEILTMTAQLASHIKELATIDQRIEALMKEENPFSGRLQALSKEIDAERTVLDASLKTQADVKKQLEIAEAAVKVFSPGGVRGQVLDEVTPYLNDQTAKYLGTLSDGNIRANWTTLVKTAKGDLREKFAIEVENAKGGKSFGLLSGGEKRKVQIAAALALQDLVSSRADKRIELFIGDEIDNALDAAGIERLMAILEEKARERGSVFVISHTPLRDWISQVMTVIKEGEVSRIEEATV